MKIGVSGRPALVGAEIVAGGCSFHPRPSSYKNNPILLLRVIPRRDTVLRMTNPQVNVRLDPKTIQHIDRHAKAREWNRQDFIRFAISHTLNQCQHAYALGIQPRQAKGRRDR